MLMERTTRFVKIVALPLGKKSDGLAVKPWVLRGLVCPVAVVCRGWLPPLMTSKAMLGPVGVFVLDGGEHPDRGVGPYRLLRSSG